MSVDRAVDSRSPVDIRNIVDGDLAFVLGLNNDHEAEVNALTGEQLARLVAVAARARILDGGHGFLIAFDETTPPQGPNHAWLRRHQSAFLYVDRIVIAPEARGRGLARRLYEDLRAVADGRPLCCEVNVEPPNAASLAFHERLGFTPCGEAIDPRNGKRVRFLLRPSDAGPRLD